MSKVEIVEFLNLIMQQSMLPYTLFLGVVVFYWITVIIGIMDIDIIDPANFGFDSVLDSAPIDALEGAEAMNDAAGGSSGALHAILAFLNLGMIPVTIIASFVSVKLWILAYFYHAYLVAYMPEKFHGIILSIGLFFVFLIVSLIMTGVTTRPLRKLFTQKSTHGHHHLVGKICKVKTTEVTSEFGQAELKVDDSFLLLSVNCTGDDFFSKGDEAVIVGYNKERDVYEIQRM